MTGDRATLSVEEFAPSTAISCNKRVRLLVAAAVAPRLAYGRVHYLAVPFGR